MNCIANKPVTQTSRSQYGRLAEWFKASDLGELKHLKLKFSDIFGCKGSNPLSLINFFLAPFSVPTTTSSQDKSNPAKNLIFQQVSW